MCACHPYAAAMLIFSVSSQLYRMIPEGNPHKYINTHTHTNSNSNTMTQVLQHYLASSKRLSPVYTPKTNIAVLMISASIAQLSWLEREAVNLKVGSRASLGVCFFATCFQTCCSKKHMPMQNFELPMLSPSG